MSSLTESSQSPPWKCQSDVKRVHSRWLLKSAPDIQSLQFFAATESEDVLLVLGKEDVNMQQLFTTVVPKVAGLLPKRADIWLDLRWGEAF